MKNLFSLLKCLLIPLTLFVSMACIGNDDTITDHALVINAGHQTDISRFLKSSVKTGVTQDVSPLMLDAKQGYWLLFDLKDVDSKNDAVLYIENTQIDQVQGYIFDKDFTRLLSSTRKTSIYLDKIIPHLFLDTPPKQAWAVLFLKHHRDISVNVKLNTTETFYSIVKKHIITLSLLTFLIIIAMAVSAALYFVSRRDKFIYLLLFLTSLLNALLASKGVYIFIDADMPFSTATKIAAVSHIFALSFLCLFFMRTSFGRQKLSIGKIKLDYVLAGTSIMSLIVSFFHFELATYLLLVAYNVQILTMIYLFNHCKETHAAQSNCYFFAWYLTFGLCLVWQATLLLPYSLAILNDVLIVLNTCLIVGGLLSEDRLKTLRYNHSLLHDDETGLPNKKLLLICLKNKATLGHAYTLVLFRPVVLAEARANFGYEHANRQIKIIMTRLSQQLSAMNAIKIEVSDIKSQFITRLDDSTYGFIVNGKLEMSQIEQFVCATTAVFGEGISHDSNHFTNRVDVGVANFPLHASSAEQLIQRGLQAMSVKPLHGERWHMYDAENSNQAQYRLEVASSLREAIEHNQLSLFFQPQVCLTTGKVHGAETLLRWHHPTLGLVPNDVFIPIAESSGIIFELTEWVVEQALLYQKQIVSTYPEHIISINISAKDLLRKELPVLFLTLLNEHQLSAENVTLELTESATLSEGVNIKTALNDYRLIGLKIAIDDFGTGYSSLAYLSQMGFDEIKIDKQFVINIEYSNNNQTICRATCDIAKSLGSYVVAEGIEDAHSLKQLKAYGCEIGQGYFFARPLAFDDYEKWLKKRSAALTVVDIDHVNSL